MNPTQHQTPPLSDNDTNFKVKKVAQILKELNRAALRPLYVEVVLHKQLVSSPCHHDEDLNTDGGVDTLHENSSEEERSWVEILGEVILLIPYLSDDDHGEVLRLCSIYLLAFLLPYSTGMDYYFTQNMATMDDDEMNADTVFSIDEYILRMPLEERLGKAAAIHSQILNDSRYGDFDEFIIMDQDVEIALGDLLEQVFVILRRRPVHTHQVDLLHLLAMMIHPHHTQTTLSESITHPTISAALIPNNCPAWAKAVRLLENPIGLQFQIHYGHRRQIVQMISKCILVPKVVYEYDPLYAGALPHLFASLLQFCHHTSEDQMDSHDALKSIVHLAVQRRHKNSDEQQNEITFTVSIYDWLVSRLMEEPGDSPCVNCRNGDNSLQNKGRTFCSYYARGEVLSEYIMLACRSDEDINLQFLSYASQSLSELIEWQADNYDDTAGDKSADVPKQSYCPCLLTSLLHAAKKLFYFLAVSKKNITEAEDDPYALLFRCCISMLRHPEHTIVNAASELIVQAVVMNKMIKCDELVSRLCKSLIVIPLQQEESSLKIQTLVSVVSGKSYAAAEFLFDYISKRFHQSQDENHGDDTKLEAKLISLNVASNWLVAISLNCPMISSKHQSAMFRMIHDCELSSENRFHVAKAALCSRLTHYFLNDNDIEVSSTVETFLTSNCKDEWERYKIGRQSLVTGHFDLAQNLFKLLLNECERIDTTQYLWISVLEHISVAEAKLSAVTDLKSRNLGGVMGIPEASTKLYSAVSYMEILRKTCTIWACGGVFQLRFLLLRLDFIDLVVVLRHLTRERRLTGKSPSKGTRSYWHVHNVAKSFEVLANRYQELYRQYGMCFKHNQSIISLAVLESLSSFMAVVTRVCYSDVFMPSKSPTMKTSYLKVDDDIIHPMASLIRRLYEMVVQPMIGEVSLDYQIRAAATLEIIDGVFLVPFPIPRDFFAPTPSCIPEFLLSADPNLVYKEYDETLSIVESAPLFGFSVYVSGSIDVQYLKASRVPVCSVLLWFRIKYSSRLIFDDDDSSDIKGIDNISNDEEPSLSDVRMSEVPVPDLSMISPAASTISHDGRFFYEVQCPPINIEGNYTLSAQLGCRDANGNDWEISGCHRTIPVQVSRSRSIL